MADQKVKSRLDIDAAAHWMYECLRDNGRLSQGDAASHLMQWGDDQVAYLNHDDSPCVGRLVLARFRTFPGVAYDRRTKSWTLERR